MNKVKLIVDVAQQVLKVVEDLRSLSDSVQVVCNTVLEGLSEEPKALPEKKAEPAISLEKVRGVLAGKSQAGYSAEVRAIVSKYGASKLSDIDPKGHYFINANSTTAPQIVDRAVKPILDRGEVYSGCYARVSLNFYAFNSNGNKGIACGLGNIQKIRDGESLGGKTSAADDFGTVADDDFLA